MTDPLASGQSPNGQEDISGRPGMPGHRPPGMPGHRAPVTGHSPTTQQTGDVETSSLPITGHRPSSHRSMELERLNPAEIQESPTTGHDRSPGSRPLVTGHQNIILTTASESHTFGTEFTSKQPRTPRVLLPLEPDSVVIEPPGNNWRSDNNNDNYRQIQTSLSGRRSRRDQSRDKHRSKKRRRRRSASTSSSSTFSSSDSRKRKSERSKHSHKKRRRRYTSPSSSSSSVSHSQVHDYGRYQRSRYSPQAVQNPQVLQPEEIPNVQTVTPDQTMSRP